ncbi:PREDICTED: uncharacterized protein LOC109243413 [Nicotiana attenuata]|uniref:uncharacterized protein LOC109243413 n=1 Tax=Nicotiana attenuata TaxID=49451 RepID=UPI000905A5E3|nr:PREDICTED: uncharacterized protein LOC109243413 [Nicotiana attenuata]
MGEMVENGLKTGKIISQAVLKAATQAVQVESDNFSDINEKDEEIMMTTGSRRGPRRTPRRCAQPHQVFHDSPEHYYPLQNTQYSVAPPQYVGQPPKHPRRRAPAPQNLHQPPQNFQVPYNPHPSQRRMFDGPLAICLGPGDTKYVLREVHEGTYGNHSGTESLVQKVIRDGYYWIDMEKDAKEFVRKCDKCQRYAVIIHQPEELMHSVLSPWPVMK